MVDDEKVYLEKSILLTSLPISTKVFLAYNSAWWSFVAESIALLNSILPRDLLIALIKLD